MPDTKPATDKDVVGARAHYERFGDRRGLALLARLELAEDVCAIAGNWLPPHHQDTLDKWLQCSKCETEVADA